LASVEVYINANRILQCGAFVWESKIGSTNQSNHGSHLYEELHVIAFSCLQCAKHYEIKEEFAGRQTKCRQCGHLLLIPHLTGSFVAAPSKAATVAVPPPTTQAGDPTATLFLARAKSATGSIYGVTITLDGQLIGTLQENERLTVKVSIGVHTIEVRGGGLHRSQTLAADSAQVLEFETYFSKWGILGGGAHSARSE